MRGGGWSLHSNSDVHYQELEGKASIWTVVDLKVGGGVKKLTNFCECL